MAVRSKRLWLPALLLPAVNTTLYTAPVGETVIVKRVTLFQGGATGIVTLRLLVGGVFHNLWQNTIELNKSADLDTWWVLQPGDGFVGRNDGLGNLFAGGFGAELEGVAD